MTWLRPTNLPGQLIALFVGVLLVAQLVNLYLLIGERRMSARSVLYETAIDNMVDEVIRVAAQPRSFARSRPPPGVPGRIHIIVSHRAAIERLQDRQCFAPYEAALGDRLSQAGIVVQISHVCRGSKLDHPPQGRRLPPPPPTGAGIQGRPPVRQGPPPDPRGPVAPGFENLVMSVKLADGRWVNGVGGHYPLENITPRIVWATVAMITLASLLIVFFARRVTRPLTNLTNAAESLGRGGSSQPLKEEGPADVRKTVSAFNRMQERLTRMIETQRIMLRSIGHDLRTPLTSLRIRAEAIEPHAEREKIIATLDEMKAMMEEILTWAEDASGLEEMSSVDINALLSSLSDDYQDAGGDVVFTDGPSMIVRCRRAALRRAIQNLVDNGLKYGRRVVLSSRVAEDQAEIIVEDEGPGIPDEKLGSVLLPFVRLETSRSKETGGSGLGLSIAQSIVQAHGADLKLENRQPRGLRVSFLLPLSRV